MSDAPFANMFSYLHKLVYECIPNMHMQIKGVRPPEKIEEWCTFNDLAAYGISSRKDVTAKRLFIEVIAYSKQAGQREDGNFKRAWEIAQEYYDLFHDARFKIENTCVQFKAARLMALDLKSLGDYAQNIDQQSPSLNLDAVVMEVEGIITQSKG